MCAGDWCDQAAQVVSQIAEGPTARMQYWDDALRSIGMHDSATREKGIENGSTATHHICHTATETQIRIRRLTWSIVEQRCGGRGLKRGRDGSRGDARVGWPIARGRELRDPTGRKLEKASSPRAHSIRTMSVMGSTRFWLRIGGMGGLASH